MRPKVLVADDDAAVRYTLRGLLEEADIEVDEASNGEEALAALSAEHFDLVLSDLRMPKMDGLALLQAVSEQEHAPRFIMITAHGSERMAVQAIKNGAYDYFRKPFEAPELLAVVERALESVRLVADNRRLHAALELSRTMVFRAQSMRHLAVAVQRVARRPVTVLITGESGTGKERLAEAIVRGSDRHDGPFIRFNCAAIVDELAEAELFGHTKGAFTGADRPRAGLIRAADGGTIFLDEIAEANPRLQAKLLRVLEEGEVRPVGGDAVRKVDVRILAATHRNLIQAVQEGTFREDLFYRLNVVHLEIPALRDRPDDIVLLAQHFLDDFGRRYGGGPFRLTAEVTARLVDWQWPGNVRELKNVIERMVAMNDGELNPSVLPRASKEKNQTSLSLAERMNAYERGVLSAALQECHGNRTEAAKRLGIGRATLYEKMEKHGIR